MTQHVPEDLLAAFTDGDVGEQLAVHIAEHLDSCPSCATQAIGMDPLAAAFAAMVDPVAPEDLAAQVMDTFSAPEPIPLIEFALGFALLGAATLISLSLGSPVALAAEFGIVLKAIGALSGALFTGFGSTPSTFLVLFTLLTLGGCVFTVRFAMPHSLPAESYGRTT
jgi:anti-sigma factor RsiW